MKVWLQQFGAIDSINALYQSYDSIWRQNKVDWSSSDKKVDVYSINGIAMH